MTVPVLTFFNNKGGVGKTSLVYHLAWMLASLGKRIVAVDLDAQANLTAAFLDEEAIESLWNDAATGATIFSAIEPLTKVGDIARPLCRAVGDGIWLVPGDVQLASFEDQLSAAWQDSTADTNLYRPFRILTAFWQVAQMAADEVQADLILIDVGPNLGAINRSALIASDFVAVPLAADLFSLQGLRNLGPTLRAWREGWQRRLHNWTAPEFSLPKGHMRPIGYVVHQHSVRLSRPVQAYDKWIRRMPSIYHAAVLNDDQRPASPSDDPECLATMKHFRSLIPMGQEARKPIFRLTAADGAIGSHAQAAQDAYKDFEALARELLRRMQEVQASPSPATSHGHSSRA